jgi:hypothetical protein
MMNNPWISMQELLVVRMDEVKKGRWLRRRGQQSIEGRAGGNLNNQQP